MLAAGWDVVQWGGIRDKVLVPSLVAPLRRRRNRVRADLRDHLADRSPLTAAREQGLSPAQLVSGGFVAFTHGTNDAQKTMGIIALALIASGDLPPDFERPRSG